MPLKICDRCIAEYAISDAEIAAMIKGADLTVSIQSLRKESEPPPGVSSGDGPANPRHDFWTPLEELSSAD